MVFQFKASGRYAVRDWFSVHTSNRFLVNVAVKWSFLKAQIYWSNLPNWLVGCDHGLQFSKSKPEKWAEHVHCICTSFVCCRGLDCNCICTMCCVKLCSDLDRVDLTVARANVDDIAFRQFQLHQSSMLSCFQWNGARERRKWTSVGFFSIQCCPSDGE